MKIQKQQIDVPSKIKDFFSEYLPIRRGCSNNTISAYRDTFSLLLKYLRSDKGVAPSKMTLNDFSAKNVLDFLKYLETKRKNSENTRNARLAAIHSFAQYLLVEKPFLSGELQGVLAIQQKRTKTLSLDFLSEGEMNAIIAAPNDKTWCGRRDHALLTLMYNTGARVSEIVDLNVSDIKIGRVGTVHIFGKGRKGRVLTLWKSTVDLLQAWIKMNGFSADSPLFPNNRRTKMTRSAVSKRLEHNVQLAMKKCPSLRSHSISPHLIRHTTAMHLLQSGIDITVIGMLLGHESTGTTHVYVQANTPMKEKALQSLQEPPMGEYRFKPSDTVLAFLENL